MKNTIATIILGIAVLFIGFALAFHIWGTEHKAEQSIESPAIEAAVDSTLWSDFSHPDTLFSYPGHDVALMHTYHNNGLLALGEYRYIHSDKKLRRYIGFWNENGRLVAIRNLNMETRQTGNRWLCIKMANSHAFYTALLEAYDASKDTYFEGLPTKNPSSCPER